MEIGAELTKGVMMAAGNILGTTMRMPEALIALAGGGGHDELSDYARTGKGDIMHIVVDAKYAVEFYDMATQQGKPLSRVQYHDGQPLPPLGENPYDSEVFLCRDCDHEALEKLRKFIRYEHSQQAKDNKHTDKEMQSYLKGEYVNTLDNLTHEQVEVIEDELLENGVEYARCRREDGTYSISVPSVELLRPQDGSMNKLEISLVDASLKLAHKPTRQYLDSKEAFRDEMARITLAYSNYGERINDANFRPGGIGDLVIFDACSAERAPEECAHVFLGDRSTDGNISFSYYECGKDRVDMSLPPVKENRLPPKFQGNLLIPEGRDALNDLVRTFKNPAIMSRADFNREMERISRAREAAVSYPDMKPDYGFSIINREYETHREGRRLLDQLNRTCESLRMDNAIVYKLDKKGGREFGMKEFRIPDTARVLSRVLEVDSFGPEREKTLYLDKIRQENELHKAITESLSNLTVSDREKYIEPQYELSDADFAVLDELRRNGDEEKVKEYLMDKGYKEEETGHLLSEVGEKDEDSLDWSRD